MFRFLAASMYFWSISLVYQLSGQFLIFLVDKKNLVDQKKIWYSKKKFGRPNKCLVYQKIIWSTKKMRNWPDNWYTKEADRFYVLKSKKKVSEWSKIFENFYLSKIFGELKFWRDIITYPHLWSTLKHIQLNVDFCQNKWSHNFFFI